MTVKERLILGPEYEHDYSLYKNQGCRCDVCRADNTRHHRAYLEGRTIPRVRKNAAVKKKAAPLSPLRGHTLRRLKKLLEQGIKERGTIEAVALDSGVSERTIGRIRSGDAKYVKFNTADLLIAGLYGPQKWTNDPVLRAYYTGEPHA